MAAGRRCGTMRFAGIRLLDSGGDLSMRTIGSLFIVSNFTWNGSGTRPESAARN